MPDGHILLVEDDPDDEALVLRALRSARLSNPIDVRRDGAEALAYFFGEEGDTVHHVPIPTIVLLDLKLPKVGGLEVLRQLKADPRTSFVPVVILTSSDEQEDIVRSYNLGVNSYVRKPVDFQEFSTKVTQLGLYWVLVNQRSQGR